MRTPSDKASATPYVATWVALLVLLAVTVGVSYVPLGRWGVVAALAIATLKTLLVVVWFMHLRDSDRLNTVVAVAGFAFFVLLAGITALDFAARG